MPRIEILDDALLIPCGTITREAAARARAQGRTIYDGGVYDAAGHPCDLARHVGGNTLNEPAPLAPETPAEALPGSWLFGGWLRQHFGHFINESLGRLWAWPGCAPPPRGLLFLPFGWRAGVNSLEAASGPADRHWLPQMLELLDIHPEAPSHVVTAPLRVERLVVPRQLALLDTPDLPAAPQLHRAFLRGTYLPERPAPVPRAYLSRSRLPPEKASFLLESMLDANFARAGYAVIHPETLSLAAQVALYQGVEMLISAEGSAIHLAAIHLPDSARIGMIWRLGSRHPPIFRQLVLAGFRRPAEFGCITGVIVSAPPGGPPPTESFAGVNWRLACAMPDFARLGQRLVAEGFADVADWEVPSQAQTEAAIEAQLALRRSLAPQSSHAWVPAARLPWPGARR
ncbi:glycosyltransferase 61 family protein [Roseomonas sp. F4]